MAEAVQEATQAPAAVTEKPAVPQFGANLDTDIRATERIEMQRVTAMVYAANQRAIQFPRKEEDCIKKILKICENVHFAADAMYKVPRGSSIVEGLNVKAMREFARIWGNLQTGVVSHGTYGNMSQFACLAIDLESNYIHGTEYTVEHARWISAKAGDPKEVQEKGGQLKPVYDPQSVGEICKAVNSKERRNAIQAVLPYYLIEAAKTQIKRTLHQAVTDVPAAWDSCKLQFAKWGVSAPSLARYLGKKISDCPQNLDAADIVDLRFLKDGIKEEPPLLDEIFPERDKSKVPAITKKEEESSTPQTPATTNKPTSSPGSQKPTSNQPKSQASSSSTATNKNSQTNSTNNSKPTPAGETKQQASQSQTAASMAPASKEGAKESIPEKSTSTQKPSSQKTVKPAPASNTEKSTSLSTEAQQKSEPKDSS
ncbi:MAG TPA: hypothetical protein EYN91_24705, partial [Candidatus Melainabacteria bacterium]|nr:hypothetical protein [Candidatus Melainabacteria bacterium]